ncbi:GNAT family N-acetyltransferase [Steroidobacter sp.]|uniref:GNAT family N-acetyltransferase n=1 Tax=Steroidobacter sp. TaxID=1978227 RepID=UPI001A51A094|nr:GNAT family N-acetyltransferase [Steroidobacter sp.]MBL8266084.1 GNAT family N-acetyltransferase [Steroidobacter sp.]
MSSVTAGELTVETLRRIDSPETLAALWQGLPQAAQEFPQSIDWTLVAAERLYGADALRLVQTRAGAEVIGLAPLGVSNGGGVERLEILGATTLYEPCGFSYRDDESLLALCKAVIGLGRPLVLQRIAADGPLEKTFRAAARGRGQLLQFKASGSPFVPIAGTWDEYFQTLSSRRRQDYRRARRNLEKLGKVEVEIRCPEPAQLQAAMTEAMQVEAASWKGRGGSAMLHNPRLSGFFLQLAERLARQGQLRLCFLRLDGVAIAMQVGAVHAGRWWVLKIGYDERWAEHSPGIQLMWDALRAAFDERLSAFEMLGSAEPWLSIWTKQERTYRTLAFYPYNGRGMIALGADIMRAFAQRLGARSQARAGARTGAKAGSTQQE